MDATSAANLLALMRCTRWSLVGQASRAVVNRARADDQSDNGHDRIPVLHFSSPCSRTERRFFDFSPNQGAPVGTSSVCGPP
jgi:hypothetical protein